MEEKSGLITPDDKSKALADWRRANFAELDKTLAVMRDIRDGISDPIIIEKCPHCKKPLANVIKLSWVSAKDKIDASKLIARILDVISPDREDSDSEAKARHRKVLEYPKLSQEQQDKLNRVMRVTEK